VPEQTCCSPLAAGAQTTADIIGPIQQLGAPPTEPAARSSKYLTWMAFEALHGGGMGGM